MDLKSQVYLKNILRKNPFPDVKNLKNVFDGFPVRNCSRDSWKAIATYIGTKEPESYTYTPFIKLKRTAHSASSFPKTTQNRLRHKSVEKRKLKVISFTNDSVILTTSVV